MNTLIVVEVLPRGDVVPNLNRHSVSSDIESSPISKLRSTQRADLPY